MWKGEALQVQKVTCMVGKLVGGGKHGAKVATLYWQLNKVG